ncbi:hypothetical protein JS528_11305 [Bifidobacterium sp. MA2]|uniref:Uncharacterized protein n=1 Tax=Bifidobacterium santillanense TaxID=2809028 RepID=A0ABS5USB2_9BIFI|nr:hypothetical protein [Bifidobacterium santillanense]MBT1173904.1 hypothetical protein [Bifidobacterium santillanense]
MTPLNLPRFTTDGGEFDDIERQAVDQLHALVGANALDSGHGDIVDEYIDDLAAPIHQRARQRYDKGLDGLDRREGALIGRTSLARAVADQAADRAADLERQFDAVYRESLDMEASHRGLNWFERLGWWRPPAGTDRRRTDEPPTIPVPGATPDPGRPTAAGAGATGHTDPCVFPWTLLAFALIGLAAEIPDPLLSLNMLDAIFNQPAVILGTSLFSLSVAGGVFLLAAVLAIGVGHHLAIRRTGASHPLPTWAIRVLVALWAGLGVAMVLMRVFEAAIEGLRPDYASSLPIALTMFILYFGSGADLCATSQLYFTGSYHRLHGVRRAMLGAQRRAARLTARAEVLVHDMEMLRDIRDRFTQRYRDHLAVLQAREDAIKRRFRLQLACEMGDPAESGLVRTPLRPEHPHRVLDAEPGIEVRS